MCLHVCDYSKHTRQDPKTKPEAIQSGHCSVCQEKWQTISLLVIFGAAFLPFHKHMWPYLPVSVNILSSSGWIFYPLPNVSVPHPCSSVVGSACRVVWLSFRCLPKVSISSRWLLQGLCKYAELKKNSRSCDGVTPKGRHRERVISLLFHTSHLPCLGCVNLKKKTDAEKI